MRTKEEIEILRADALAGDPGAQLDLGYEIINGDNPNNAFKWFELAAKQGHEGGLYAVAMCYREGWGVKRDINKAKEWLEKSAIRGNMLAANELGELYEKESNPDEAFYWYNFGKSEEIAKYNLARCYEQGIGTIKRLHSAYNLYKECKREDIKKRIESVKKSKNLSKYYDSLIASLPEKKIEAIRTIYNPVLDTRLVNIDILGNNPFRVLGVYSNASEKEIRANRSRIEAMARVGKTYPYDIDHIIPSNIADNLVTLQNRIQYAQKSAEKHISIRSAKFELELKDWSEAEKTKPDWACLPNRSLTEVENAVNKINSDTERIKYALFWFCNHTTTDNKAIELLINHKWDEAMDVWRQEKNFSARINRALMLFYERNDHYAIDEILHLIRSDYDRTEFVDVITSGRMQLSYDELYSIYVDTLFELPDTEVSIYELTEFKTKKLFNKSGYNYFTSKLFDKISAPLEERLQVAESQDPKDWEKSTEAFNNVASISLKTIKQLHHFVGEDYYRYKLFCNELALKLLEFGIHYNNNNKEDWNAPTTALHFAKLANDIAIDETLLERCKKNIDIFKNNTNITQTEKALEVIDEKIKKIDGIRVTFSEIETTLKSITAYLDVVRDHAGKDSAIYLNESSRVVNIFLNRVIDICNYSKSFFTDSGAAPILKQLQKMDMTSETRHRLERNIKTLSGNLSSVLGESAWEKVKDTTKQSNLLDNLPDADIQIKAPKKVIVGDKFEVKYTVKGKVDKMESPKTSNLTLVGGPSTSSIESVMYGHIKSFSTVFSFTFQANFVGIATLGAVSCVVEGKRLESHNFIIQVQKGTTQQQTKALGIEERAKQDKKEEDLWLACSKSKAYEIYLQQFPNGKYRLDATNKIKAKAEKRFWLWTGGTILIIAVVCLLIFIN